MLSGAERGKGINLLTSNDTQPALPAWVTIKLVAKAFVLAKSTRITKISTSQNALFRISLHAVLPGWPMCCTGLVGDRDFQGGNIRHSDLWLVEKQAGSCTAGLPQLTNLKLNTFLHLVHNLSLTTSFEVFQGKKGKHAVMWMTQKILHGCNHRSFWKNAHKAK